MNKENKNILYSYAKKHRYVEVGESKIDVDRKNRRKFPEVIFGQGKNLDHLYEIIDYFYEEREDLLVTRLSKDKVKAISQKYEDIYVNKSAGIVSKKFKEKEKIGLITICSGGSSDIPVCEEARETAEFFGANTKCFYDIGVSGLSRLISKINEIKEANVIVAVAGMEGALPTVLAGLVDKPIIAVPTSVGYGANRDGLTTMLGMLSSCSEGVNVVNIDNGYGAAYNAAQINRLIEVKK